MPWLLYAGVSEIEDQLRALGERWSHACQWTLSRLERLQRCGALDQQAAKLRTDILELETDLKQVGYVSVKRFFASFLK